MIIQEMINKVNELASQVIPADWLESFLELPLKSKLVGIMTFVAMGKDEEVIQFAQKAIKYVEAQ